MRYRPARVGAAALAVVLVSTPDNQDWNLDDLQFTNPS